MATVTGQRLRRKQPLVALAQVTERWISARASSGSCRCGQRCWVAAREQGIETRLSGRTLVAFPRCLCLGRSACRRGAVLCGGEQAAVDEHECLAEQVVGHR